MPVIYLRNFDEVTNAEKQGLTIDKEEYTAITTFIIPNNKLIRINPQPENKKTTIYFDEDAYEIDAEYETVLELFKRQFKNPCLI